MTEVKFFKSKSGETMSFCIVEPIEGGEEQLLVFIETPNSTEKELAMFFTPEEFIEMATAIINEATGGNFIVQRIKNNYSLN
jgi:hypothetical protein